MTKGEEIHLRFSRGYYLLEGGKYLYEAIDDAIAEEREACATLVEEVCRENRNCDCPIHGLPEAIRARGVK